MVHDHCPICRRMDPEFIEYSPEQSIAINERIKEDHLAKYEEERRRYPEDNEDNKYIREYTYTKLWSTYWERICYTCYQKYTTTIEEQKELSVTDIRYRRIPSGRRNFYQMTYGYPFRGDDGQTYVRIAGPVNSNIIFLHDEDKIHTQKKAMDSLKKERVCTYCWKWDQPGLILCSTLDPPLHSGYCREEPENKWCEQCVTKYYAKEEKIFPKN